MIHELLSRKLTILSLIIPSNILLAMDVKLMEHEISWYMFIAFLEDWDDVFSFPVDRD